MCTEYCGKQDPARPAMLGTPTLVVTFSTNLHVLCRKWVQLANTFGGRRFKMLFDTAFSPSSVHL